MVSLAYSFWHEGEVSRQRVPHLSRPHIFCALAFPQLYPGDRTSVLIRLGQGMATVTMPPVDATSC
jgi:hypothetical protein